MPSTRYIPVAYETGANPNEYIWDLFDTEQRRLARWGERRDYIQRYVEGGAERPAEMEELAWTRWEYMTAAEQEACRVRPQASPEFWQEVLLVADAAGYCEVFDRIAHVMGGPVRSQNAQVQHTYVTLTVMVYVPDGTQVDALTRPVRDALAPIDGLRFQTAVDAQITESPDVLALRARVEELRAQRAPQTAE